MTRHDDNHHSESDHEDENEDVDHDATIALRMSEFVETQNEHNSAVDLETDESLDTLCVASDGSFMNRCACTKNCFGIFSDNEIKEHIFNMREMTKVEKELYIMGTLQTGCFGQTTKRNTKRKRVHYTYNFKGESICRDAFLAIYDVTDKVLSSIVTHVNTNGVCPREHGNKRKKPAHALKFEEIENAVKFIKNYAEEFGIPQPEAPRGSDGIPPVYLPASDTKKAIHQRYVKSCEESSIRAMKISSFEDVWLKCIPHIRISTPRDDVCQKCECLRKKIMDARTEEEKLTSVRAFQDHIEAARKERQHYRECIQEAVEEMGQWQGGQLQNVHYTFDFAQHFQLPHHARQMGPTYFVMLRRVQLFGVCIDSASIQLNFLVDENQTIGQDGTLTNGANAVISMLDYTFNEYGFGEKSCSLHADNCSGQNKNQYMLAYLCWRVLMGFHERISLKMQIPGHTRCLVDGGFGHIRKLFRRSDVDSFNQLVDVVQKSASSNVAIPYKHEDGGATWEWRDWKSFLSTNFKAVRNIRKYHHFRFSCQDPGYVFLKESVDSEETSVSIMKSPISDPHARPILITPPGLSRDRQTYLYRNVRPYVRPLHQEEVCPTPTDLEE